MVLIGANKVISKNKKRPITFSFGNSDDGVILDLKDLKD